MLSAGEASGDLHGADLARAIVAAAPGTTMFGMGGPMMQEAGVDLVFNPTSMSTVGFVEALRSVGVLRRVLSRLAEAMDERRPDVLVCIDFPGFNLRLAEVAHRKGIPVLYYFSPTVWAWGKGRADKLARLDATILAVFPFEAEAYRRAGCRVEFVGHPLLDRVRPTADRDTLRQEFGAAPGAPLIGLLPGSREQELSRLLPPMLAAARLVQDKQPGARFALPVAHTLRVADVERMAAEAAGLPLAVVQGRTYDVLHAADAAMISMGTATLEAALLGVPHVACYQVSSSTYRLARFLVKLPYFALPNIVMGRAVIPELVQAAVTGDNLAREVLGLLVPERNWAMRGELAQVRARLGDGGAVERAARVVLARAAAAGAS